MGTFWGRFRGRLRGLTLWRCPVRNAIRRFLTWLGGLAFLYLVVMGIVLFVMTRKKEVPKQTILELDLEREVVEYVPDDPLAKATGTNRLALHQVTMALERAENDPRVVGLVAKLGAAKHGFGTLQELRDAIVRFRQKGKFAVAFSETFGEFSNGLGVYYLATAFDEIWMQPSGDLSLAGLYLETMFLRGSLDKLGVKPRMDHRKEYKNAMNMLTEKSMTPAHREAMTKIMDGIFGQFVAGVASARKLSVEEVRAAIEKGPILGKEALAAKFVDQLGYHDECYAAAKKRAQGAELLYLHKYTDRTEMLHQKGKRVALIYGVGPVTRGKSSFDAMDGSTTLGAATVAAGFRAAIEDKEVKAIVFRVNSPGGSYVASDVIWQEVERAKKAGKKVVVSMGDVAGSGGYFVAMAADKIVAQPGTITGSIGVVGGKLVPTELWEKLGLSFDEVHIGQNAGFFSMNHDYNESEWGRLQAWLDRIYEDFTGKVAQGRKLDLARVQQLAKGRIWTGEDAKTLGLIDEVGGLHTALALSKKLAGIPDGEDVDLKVFPRDKGPIAQIIDKLRHKDPDNSDKEGGAIEVRLEVLDAAHKAVRQGQTWLGTSSGVLTMPLGEFAF